MVLIWGLAVLLSCPRVLAFLPAAALARRQVCGSSTLARSSTSSSEEAQELLAQARQLRSEADALESVAVQSRRPVDVEAAPAPVVFPETLLNSCWSIDMTITGKKDDREGIVPIRLKFACKVRPAIAVAFFFTSGTKSH
jgi:hypothetical protein